jgi:hypothetical protein
MNGTLVRISKQVLVNAQDIISDKNSMIHVLGQTPRYSERKPPYYKTRILPLS